MKIDARISITTPQNNIDDAVFVDIEIEDRTSNQKFVTIRMNAEQFVLAALRHVGNCEVESCEVFSLERVGKKLELGKLEFVMPECDYRKRNEIACKLAMKECPEGWTPDLYFGSKDSFFNPGPGMAEMARTTIRRWVNY